MTPTYYQKKRRAKMLVAKSGEVYYIKAGQLHMSESWTEYQKQLKLERTWVRFDLEGTKYQIPITEYPRIIGLAQRLPLEEMNRVVKETMRLKEENRL